MGGSLSKTQMQSRLRDLPLTALVSYVVLKGSTNLALVQEGTIHEFVQKTTL